VLPCHTHSAAFLSFLAANASTHSGEKLKFELSAFAFIPSGDKKNHFERSRGPSVAAGPGVAYPLTPLSTALTGFMTHVTCRLTAKTEISSGTLRSAIEYGLPLPCLAYTVADVIIDALRIVRGAGSM